MPIFVVYLNAKLSQEGPTLMYSLSESIPTNLSGDSFLESIQELSILNLGNLPAKKIRVKINTTIKKYELLKYSPSDKVSVNHSDNVFELLYDELPPDSQFKLVINSNWPSLLKGTLDVSHSKGKAVEKLKDIMSKINIYLFWGLIAIYFLAMIFGSRKMSIDSLESNSKYDPLKLLKRKQPLYISNEKWDAFRENSIKNLIKRDYYYFSEPYETPSYKFLYKDKPDFLSDLEWERLVEESNEMLSKLLIHKVEFISFYRDSENLLNLKRPKHFREKEWNEIFQKINERVITNRIEELIEYHLRSDTILKEIKKDFPKGAIPELWEKYHVFIRELYFVAIAVECASSISPIKELKLKEINLLEKYCRNRLQDLAYHMQLMKILPLHDIKKAEEFLNNKETDWIAENDYNILKKQAEHTLELNKLLNKNTIIQNSLKTILDRIPLSDSMIKELPETDKEKLKQINSSIVETEKEIKKKENELNKLSLHTESLKSKIEKQLNIIHEFIQDPTVFERIEDYSNVFAPGNFKNLLKIAEFRKKTADSKDLRDVQRAPVKTGNI